MKPVTMSTLNSSPKRMALYARVSTDEQTEGNYPSCDSQLEEMEAACRTQGWQAHRTIRDEGYSAGTMKRPGLTELRWMVQNGEVDGIICTWYDRLTRSRDFYILDHEFKTHNVDFVTLHDPTDTTTAAGRFMESMLVAAKTYEREQTGEKVRTKMRMRLEKGMHQGGLVPFGFVVDAETKILAPDPERVSLLPQIFQVYVETRSDFAVREWLKAHQIPNPRGKSLWQVSSIRDLLGNRRYIAEIEINRNNKRLEGLKEADAYRVVKAPHEPLLARELFELAQAIRQEKAKASPNRRGRPRSFSQTQCQRVYPLQGILVCGACTHAMAPWYVHHKPGKDRKKESFVNYYACAQQIKAYRHTDHKNLVLARLAESWILERIEELAQSKTVVEEAVACALAKCESELQPERDALTLNRAALQENEAQMRHMVNTIGSGQADGALLVMLNARAAELQREQAQLRVEYRRLEQALVPLQQDFDTAKFRAHLANLTRLTKIAEAEELQRLLRLGVKRIKWELNGEHEVDFYYLPEVRPQSVESLDWFNTNRWSGGPERSTYEPLIFRLHFLSRLVPVLATAAVRAASWASTRATVCSFG